jgi:hypothetical protein
LLFGFDLVLIMVKWGIERWMLFGILMEVVVGIEMVMNEFPKFLHLCYWVFFCSVLLLPPLFWFFALIYRVYWWRFITMR